MNLRVVLWIAFYVCAHCSIAHTEDDSKEVFIPISNDEFFGVKSKSRITEVFEIYDPHSLEDLRAVKAMGFDRVILDRAPLHKQATEVGLDVVIANWWKSETKKSEIDAMMELAKQVKPGKLKAISTMDEPELNAPDTPFEYYINLYKRLKPQLADELEGVDIEISYWGPIARWDQRYYDLFSFLYEACDRMRIMPYPDLHEHPLGDVYLMLQRSKRAMKIAQVEIPHVVILQTWILPPKNELPTIGELRVMAYQAMLGGAEVLSFFEYKPEVWQKTEGFSESFADLMVELQEVRSHMKGAEIETVLNENWILEATVTWDDKRQEKFLVNTSRESVDGLKGLEIRVVEVAGQSEKQPNEEHFMVSAVIDACQPRPAVSRCGEVAIQCEPASKTTWRPCESRPVLFPRIRQLLRCR